jgi:hypothetical protein
MPEQPAAAVPDYPARAAKGSRRSSGYHARYPHALHPYTGLAGPVWGMPQSAPVRAVQGAVPFSALA